MQNGGQFESWRCAVYSSRDDDVDERGGNESNVNGAEMVNASLVCANCRGTVSWPLAAANISFRFRIWRYAKIPPAAKKRRTRVTATAILVAARFRDCAAAAAAAARAASAIAVALPLEETRPVQSTLAEPLV